jgi:5-methyltetrahydrofolate--homocysteine methyltransferase
MATPPHALPRDRIIVIGENFNATRKIKATSPRVKEIDGRTGIAYTSLGGEAKLLDCSDVLPEDPAARNSFMIPHIAQALRNKDMDYIAWAIKSQERAGAHIIDLCVDEMSVYPEERYEWIRFLVRTAQSITDSIVSIDSSDSKTIFAGLEVHDSSKSRPAINSFNLEDGRQELVAMAKERNALLFANASGNTGMPQDADGRVQNLLQCMQLMDEGGIPMEDRFLDPLVFPVGAGPEFGAHYLDAVRRLREAFPDVHIFGGHSNVSFGLPNRKLLNDVFVTLAIQAGCDAAMIDPMMNPPARFDGFKLAADALTGVDEYSVKYLKFARAERKKKAA